MAREDVEVVIEYLNVEHGFKKSANYLLTATKDSISVSFWFIEDRNKVLEDLPVHLMDISWQSWGPHYKINFSKEALEWILSER